MTKRKADPKAIPDEKHVQTAVALVRDAVLVLDNVKPGPLGDVAQFAGDRLATLADQLENKIAE